MTSDATAPLPAAKKDAGQIAYGCCRLCAITSEHRHPSDPPPPYRPRVASPGGTSS